MARRVRSIDEEQKSYSAVFLLAVGVLLAGAVWAVWDDNISRRPWKKYQAEFFALEVERARQALATEEERLEADPAYQETATQLAAARQQLESGETARRLAQLGAQRQDARMRADEWEFNLRLVKSKLEEAWYEYEHAVLTRQPTDAPRARLGELNAEKARVEEGLAAAEAQVQQIENEISERRSVADGLEDKLGDLAAARERLAQRLDGLLLQVGPVQLPRVPKIWQVVLNEFDRNTYDQPVARVDRCASCHAGIEKPGFEDDPNPFKTHPHREGLLAQHPPERFGCTPCHAGQGAAVNSIAKAHGEVKFWEHPLRRGDMVQASCIGCHLDLQRPGAETIARGENLFVQLGCHGCHLTAGYAELEKAGPSLRRIAAKVRPQWLVRWVEQPHRYRPRSRMPDFLLTAPEATAVAAYLLDASKSESEAWLAGHPPPAGVDSGDGDRVAQGQAFADSLGCRACHGFADDESPALLGEDKDVAPNLGRIAEKTDARWLYHWLRNPRGYSPVSRMPSLRLGDDETAALTSFLLTLGTPAASGPDGTLQAAETIAQGKTLVRKFGCAGCHDIPGMENESRIGVELSAFGSKPLEELFFGNHTDIDPTWYDWTYHKLKEPRTYETERIEQLMPQFRLAEADIQALLVFLASRTDEHAPAAYWPADAERERTLVRGRRVAEKYNCVGCHVIEQRGGAILARYEENPSMAPPILNGEGEKVQPDWLFGFLKQPIPLRPWLKVRMPTFGLSDQEAAALVEYFMAQDAVKLPFVYVDRDAISAEHVEAGRLLASADYFNCFSCHQQGDQKPEGPEEGWAPDLALAKERLRPEWIVRWLRDPQALQPATKMPSFYNFEDPEPGGPDDILDGDDERQVEALRDYLMALGRAEPPPRVEAAAASAVAIE